MTTIDLNAKEEINYKKSYVAFLDVLGFKNLIFSTKSEDKDKLEEYFGIVNSAIKYLESIPSKNAIGIGSIVISDSIILSVPFGNSNNDNIERLRHLCVAIALIQHGLAVKDIWIRGAISCGDTYFNKQTHQVIGKAYIQAFVLEEKLANVPRVILDNKIIKELKFNSATQLIQIINSEQFTNWSSSILFDWDNKDFNLATIEKDIPLFIDYLDFPVSYKGTNFSRNIHDNVLKNIYNNTHLYKKFKWVASYYVLKLNEHDNESLLIPELLNL